MTELQEVPGIGPAMVRTLRKSGVITAEILAVQTVRWLTNNAHLGEAKSQSIVKNARDLVGLSTPLSGIEVEDRMLTRPRLRTGVDTLDSVLGGGIEAGSIVEIYGPAAAGKTVLCHQLAVMAQMPVESGGLEGAVWWIDTEHSFKSSVIRGMAHRMHLDPRKVLENIHHNVIVDSEQVLRERQVWGMFFHNYNIRLVVIDCLIDLVWRDSPSIEFLLVRQHSMDLLINRLRNLGRVMDVVFVITGRSLVIPGFYGGMRNTPVRDGLMVQGADYVLRVSQKRGSGPDERKVRFRGNASLPEGIAQVTIGWGGLYRDSKSKQASEPDVMRLLGVEEAEND